MSSRSLPALIRPLENEHTQTWLTWASFCWMLIFFVWYVLRSTGTYQDDDIAHYLIAKWSWQHPALFFDLWGKPTFTILYAPIAPLGLTAVQLYSALLAALTCLGAAYLAKLYQVEWYWLAIPLTGLQPEFLRQGFSSLTELSSALVLCLALIAHKRRAWTLMAFTAGWLPLSRFEALSVVALFMFVLVREKRYWLLPLALAPTVIQKVVLTSQSLNWADLIFPLDRLISGAAATYADAGTGPWWHFSALMPVAYGGICFALASSGFLGTRWNLLHAAFLATLAGLSLTYWLLPSTGNGGWIRYLAPVSPIVGVFAAVGLGRLSRPQAVRWRLITMAAMLTVAAWLFNRQMFAAAGTAVLAAFLPLWPGDRRTVSRLVAGALLVLMAISVITQVRPHQLVEEQRLAIEAGQWYRASEYRNRLVLGSHAWFVYAADLDEFDPAIFRHVTPNQVNDAPVGSVIVWDSHYSHRLIWKTPLAMLQDAARFREVRLFKGGPFELHVYEKTST